MSDIPLAEQIAAVERALYVSRRICVEIAGATDEVTSGSAQKEADRLAAALATLRGLLERSEA